MQWRDSGLSKTAYAQRHSLSYQQMAYWSNKKDLVDEQEVALGGFVPVSVLPTPENVALCVRLANGATIEGITERNVDLVSELIKRL